ncbi:hypothetical protein J8I82_34885 [Cupriavidus sp. LEh25]|nr:hypothetical protein [Cupriavidus sp. LEh25]
MGKHGFRRRLGQEGIGAIFYDQKIVRVGKQRQLARSSSGMTVPSGLCSVGVVLTFDGNAATAGNGSMVAFAAPSHAAVTTTPGQGRFCRAGDIALSPRTAE